MDKINTFSKNDWEYKTQLFLENWSPDLRQLAIPYEGITFTMDDQRFIHNLESFDENFPIEWLIERIETLCKSFKGVSYFFVRIGSRFPNFASNHSPHDFLSSLRGNRDVIFDLCEMIDHKYCASLYISPWFIIPRWTQFRCVIWNSKLVGITQMSHVPFQRIIKDARVIETEINQFFNKQVFNVLHVKDCIIDIIAMPEDNLIYNKYNITILTIHPFSRDVDPYLFNWDSAFASRGEFRYVQTPIKVLSGLEQIFE
jgi:hypothetical protein